MKIATWNINSLRVRLPHILDWLEKNNTDVLALQELKMENKDFPVEVFKKLNYHVSFSGQKTYNGVAIISRSEIADPEMPDYDEQRRILAVTIQGVRVINVYIPNGESMESPKYQYKLKWLENLKQYLSAELKKYPKLILLGDFNIAPEELDVYEPDLWRDSVLFTTQMREVFKSLEGLGLNDSFRLFPQEPKSFSWWDYRTAGFPRNHGLRIDHILVSEPLKEACEQCVIDKVPRGWERPSDHTPVVLTLRVV
ncbi:MAG: exodeoxyribonuclease III [Gammaproteobacteria bacterium]|nr:exodeoxyribonuclease III [Gammaproteobacteria bacterium]